MGLASFEFACFSPFFRFFLETMGTIVNLTSSCVWTGKGPKAFAGGLTHSSWSELGMGQLVSVVDKRVVRCRLDPPFLSVIFFFSFEYRANSFPLDPEFKRKIGLRIHATVNKNRTIS